MWQLQILLVDDCKEWRQTLRSILEPIPYCQVIGEASDAFEGIEKAAQLHPDIVLLDIGMPVLNGLEAVPRIRRASPKSKIIFVTQETSHDVKEAALATGAEDYLLKSSVASNLPPALEGFLVPKMPEAIEITSREAHETCGLPVTS